MEQAIGIGNASIIAWRRQSGPSLAYAVGDPAD
jgi:hypothetical protein